MEEIKPKSLILRKNEETLFQEFHRKFTEPEVSCYVSLRIDKKFKLDRSKQKSDCYKINLLGMKLKTAKKTVPFKSLVLSNLKFCYNANFLFSLPASSLQRQTN